VEGYVGYDADEPSYLVRETTLCDLERGACRSLPTGVERTALVEMGDAFVPRRTVWRTRVVVSRGRVRLADVRGAPAAVQRLGRGVPLDAFFTTPSVSGAEQDLYPEARTERAPP